MGNAKIFTKSSVLRGRQAGQGMTEYIIIVALIAVAAIGVYSYFGQTLRNQTAGMAKEMSGQDSTDSVGKAKSAADNSSTSANKTKSLGSYGATKELESGGTR